MLILYSVTLFLSASLLFIVQPLFAKMVLPLLGGSPAVWNTALVFYQAVLLAGYAYAHFITQRLSYRHQILLHLFLLCLPLLILPIHLPQGWTPPTESSPVLWLLALLGVAVGLPFFVISAISPLLQRWLVGTGHPAGKDPYFLYSASNLGSLLALLAYPLLVEPSLRLVTQSQAWAVGYGVLLLLMIGCGVLLWRSPSAGTGVENQAGITEGEALTFWRRVKWLLLAFVPSSLMLSVTTYISTDIAAIPLLWVIPLALYLLTFVLVFARQPLLPQRWIIRAAPVVLLALVIAVILKLHASVTVQMISFHLFTFFVIALVCHGELARDRPAAGRLTEFYLWLSLGGVLGGVFNALLAPLIFKEVSEYSLTIVLAGLLLPTALSPVQSKRQQKARPKSQWEDWKWLEPWQLFEQRYGRILDFGFPLALALLATGLIVTLQNPNPNLVSDPLAVEVMFGLPVLICFSFFRRPVRFGLGLGAILLAGTFYFGGQGHVLHVTRSFFGITRVASFSAQEYHLLVHGNTIHGIQSPEPARRKEPLSYYTHTGPLGELFTALSEAWASAHIAVVGLGAGTVACYRQPGQQWTFYEIDPNVEQIAREARYFTFLSDCAPEAKVVLGDARLSLASAPTGGYDLMILDAYSSDAIPVHLLTREALQLYLDKLAPRGVLAFHLTNSHLNLEPVVFNLALQAGATYRIRRDSGSLSDFEMGKMSSVWAVIARTPADLGSLAEDPQWVLPPTSPKQAVWTDDFSSLLSVFVWR